VALSNEMRGIIVSESCSDNPRLKVWWSDGGWVKTLSVVRAPTTAPPAQWGGNVEVRLDALPFGYAVSQTSDKRTIYLWRELDFAASIELMPKLADLCGPTMTDVCLDLSRVEFIDSEGIKSLITLFEAVRVNGGIPRIARHSPSTRRTIRMAGVEKLLHPEDNSLSTFPVLPKLEAIN